MTESSPNYALFQKAAKRSHEKAAARAHTRNRHTLHNIVDLAQHNLRRQEEAIHWNWRRRRRNAIQIGKKQTDLYATSCITINATIQPETNAAGEGEHQLYVLYWTSSTVAHEEASQTTKNWNWSGLFKDKSIPGTEFNPARNKQFRWHTMTVRQNCKPRVELGCHRVL